MKMAVKSLVYCILALPTLAFADWAKVREVINNLSPDVRTHILSRVNSASSTDRARLQSELEQTLERFKSEMHQMDSRRPISIVYRNFYASHGLYDREEANIEQRFENAMLDVVNRKEGCDSQLGEQRR